MNLTPTLEKRGQRKNEEKTAKMEKDGAGSRNIEVPKGSVSSHREKSIECQWRGPEVAS